MERKFIMSKCLIVVDYQNDFVSGSLGFEGAELLDARIAEKIKQYRASGDTVMFTFDTHTDDYLNTQEGENLPVPHCIKGTKGHEFYGETAKLIRDTDKCFYKPGFWSDELYEYLKDIPFDSIELVGLVTNICIISNVVLAKTAQPETPIIVDSTCIGCSDPKLNEETLHVMRGLQVKVID